MDAEGDETVVPWGSGDDRAVDRDDPPAVVFTRRGPGNFVYGRFPPVLPHDVKPGLKHVLEFAG